MELQMWLIMHSVAKNFVVGSKKMNNFFSKLKDFLKISCKDESNIFLGNCTKRWLEVYKVYYYIEQTPFYHPIFYIIHFWPGFLRTSVLPKFPQLFRYEVFWEIESWPEVKFFHYIDWTVSSWEELYVYT